MPIPLSTQPVIAFIWDFDHTLIRGDMQAPIFEAYDVDAEEFWREVNALVDHHRSHGEVVSRHYAYILHLLTYVRTGRLRGLSNAKLREFGALLEPAPGMPAFLGEVRNRVASIPEFAREGISVEHYVISTGLQPLIEGSPFAPYLDGVWANTFIEEAAEPGFLDQLPVRSGDVAIAHLGYPMDLTTKTRAVFEINKGANVDPKIDVHAPMGQAQRRVPLRNMIFVADGATDVPVFSILNANGGKTLGVYSPAPDGNEVAVRLLHEQGRVHAVAEADFRTGALAYDWLMEGMEQIGYEIVEHRRQAFAAAPDESR